MGRTAHRPPSGPSSADRYDRPWSNRLMASSKAVWGIDLGQCALKAIKLRFDAKEDKAVAEAFDFIEHPKILSQPDAEPEELIRGALEKFLSRNDTEGCDLVVSIPGQAGLSRFVKLPPVEAKKIPDIVQFEARQQIPFPLEEVVWDYQRIGSAEEQEGFALETEVALFAIKKDAVNRYLAPYQSMGMHIDTVQLAPVALYNFAALRPPNPPMRRPPPKRKRRKRKPSCCSTWAPTRPTS
jgi:type IV pilus assembly protein PilM